MPTSNEPVLIDAAARFGFSPKPIAEIAAELGASQKAVEHLLTRALIKLRAAQKMHAFTHLVVLTHAYHERAEHVRNTSQTCG